MTMPRPWRSAASATANGRLPPPQMIASGPSLSLTARLRSLMHRRCFRMSAFTAPWRHHGRARSSFAQKINDLADQRRGDIFCRYRLDAIAKLTGPQEQCPKALAKLMQVGAAMTSPLEPDHVQPDKLGPLTQRKSERDHFTGDTADPPDHCVFTNPHELVHRRLPTQHRAVA